MYDQSSRDGHGSDLEGRWLSEWSMGIQTSNVRCVAIFEDWPGTTAESTYMYVGVLLFSNYRQGRPLMVSMPPCQARKAPVIHGYHHHCWFARGGIFCIVLLASVFYYLLYRGFASSDERIVTTISINGPVTRK